MTDSRRSRQPSPPRPARARSRAAAGDLLQMGGGEEPALGEVRFDEWFGTPVFESDADERLEELATARRGPMRLAASTFLRINARASRVRHRPEPDAPIEEPDSAEPERPKARAGRAATPVAKAAQPKVQPRAKPEPKPEPKAKADSSQPEPSQPAAPAPLRQRVGAALDRWAEREAASQARLERLILPRRWQA